MVEETPIKTLASRIVWESKWYRVRQDDISLPNGDSGVYNVVEMSDCVFVVPILADGRIVLIRNYRHTLKQWVWELPAGSIEDGSSAEEAAKAELLEEIGGVAESYQFLQRISVCNGIGDIHANLFLARNVVLQEQALEAGEFIDVHPMSVDDVYELVFSGKMNDVVSVAALLLARHLI